MRVVLQRVSRAAVRAQTAEGWATSGAIESGFLALVGVSVQDTEADARALATKVAHLRVFEDAEGKLNRSLLEIGGAALVVSNFTLYADCRKGRRPSFTEAAPSAKAQALYEAFGAALAAHGVPVQYGVFGAQMEIELTNAGPITLLLESESRRDAS